MIQTVQLMAKYSNGINGAFTGKIGNVVGTNWKGLSVMRSAPGKRSAKSKGDEKQNQTKFSIAHYWLQPLLDILREGFKGYSQQVEGFNAAKSYVLNNAFEGQKPNIYINPALVRISAGDLPLQSDITAALNTEKSRRGIAAIEFTWDTTNVSYEADSWDQVMVAAYDVEKSRAFSMIHGQFRFTGSHILEVESGHTYHLYLAFSARDRSRQSDSVYLGEITV